MSEWTPERHAKAVDHAKSLRSWGCMAADDIGPAADDLLAACAEIERLNEALRELATTDVEVVAEVVAEADAAIMTPDAVEFEAAREVCEAVEAYMADDTRHIDTVMGPLRHWQEVAAPTPKSKEAQGEQDDPLHYPVETGTTRDPWHNPLPGDVLDGGSGHVRLVLGVGNVDTALCAGNFDAVDSALRAVGVSTAPVEVLVAWLTITLAAKGHLPYRATFVELVRQQLEAVGEEDIAGVLRGLQ